MVNYHQKQVDKTNPKIKSLIRHGADHNLAGKASHH